VTNDEIDDDLELDVREECSKVGTVRHIKITPSQVAFTFEKPIILFIKQINNTTKIIKEGDFAKIYIQFATENDAGKAIQLFDGRFYGGHKIVAQYYDNNRFELRDFD